MTTSDLGFIHVHEPPADGITTTLLVLHGTGGNEHDLVPLARELLPGAGILSPRGKVLERGMPRFFRRLAEGVFDREDLAFRTDELDAFIGAAAKAYGFDRDHLVAFGFSNGANIAASLILKHPGALRAGVLLSPMLPFQPDPVPDLKGTSVFLGAGEADTMVPPEKTRLLVDVLRQGGADVTEHWHPSGHTITHDELRAIRNWLRERG